MNPLKVLLQTYNARLLVQFRALMTLLGGVAGETPSTASARFTNGETNVIAAVNKNTADITANESASLQIDDNAASGTTTYSGVKIDSDIQTAVNDAGAASTAAIAAALEGQDLSDLADNLAANAAVDAGQLAFSGPQTLTDAQKSQAQVNAGLGDLLTLDLVAEFEAGLNV